MKYFNIQGVLRYSPIRNGIVSNKNILVLDVDCEDLALYHQWFIKKTYGINLSIPMFGTHVTVIKPEEADINNPLWGFYEGHKISVDYELIERHWKFWSLNILSKDLVKIRENFGLNPFFRLHMTIGRQENYEHEFIIPQIIHDIDYLPHKPI